MNQRWKCKRCGSEVDMAAFRCKCTESPSPWELIENEHNQVDAEYFRLAKLILADGRVKKNRTGIDTIGVFGAQAKFDIDLNAFPILTTKKVWFKGILHELLWFIKGDTNIKYLVDNDVHIWDSWAYARYMKTPTNQGVADMIDRGWNNWTSLTQEEFIARIKSNADFAELWGELGEGTYGGMWRAFPFHVNDDHIKEAPHIKTDNYGYDGGENDNFVTFGRYDQLQKVIDKLKTNPDDRRMIVSAWHPYWADHCALSPCHCFMQFNTEELTLEERAQLYLNKYGVGGHFELPPEPMEQEFDKLNIPKRKLNLLMLIRSNDFFLGAPFNITSYSLLVAMIAQSVNMTPGVLTYTIGDAHIYQNHLEQINLQLTRTPMKLPQLWLNPEIKSLFDFKYDDVKLIDYKSHPAIKGEVAV